MERTCGGRKKETGTDNTKVNTAAVPVSPAFA